VRALVGDTLLEVCIDNEIDEVEGMGLCEAHLSCRACEDHANLPTSMMIVQVLVKARVLVLPVT